MRILLVNVNTSVEATGAMVEAGLVAALAGTEVVGLTPDFGAAGVDSNVQSLIAAVAMMDAVRGYREPYDAVIVGGFGEHGREGLQELVDVPVLDIAECAAHVAMMLGRTYSVVTTLQRSVAQVEDRLLLAGLSARCASVRAIGLATRELDEDPVAATAAVIETARRAVDDDHAEVIVLGCGGMAGLDREVSAALGVPVIDGVAAAVSVAESLVRLGLRTTSVGSCAAPDLSATTWPLAPETPMSDVSPIVPADFDVPLTLEGPGFRLEPLTVAHNAEDFAAWYGSRAHIHATPGFAGREWPTEDYTLEQNECDLAEHEEDFAKRIGFTYTVLDAQTSEVIGCVYLYPPKREGFDLDARSWVRADHAELDKPLYDAVVAWVASDWPFSSVDYAPR